MKREYRPFAVLLIITALLAGCSYPGDEEDRAAYQAQQTGEPAAEPAHDGTEADAGPGAASSETPAEPDASTEPEPTESEAAAQQVPLVADTGDTYLRANDAAGLLAPPNVFGPWMTQYVIDGEAFMYREIVCSGTAVTEATGVLRSGTVVWDDGADPWIGDEEREASEITVGGDEATVLSGGSASADHEGQREEFVGYCKNTGEDIGKLATGW